MPKLTDTGSALLSPLLEQDQPHSEIVQVPILNQWLSNAIDPSLAEFVDPRSVSRAYRFYSAYERTKEGERRARPPFSISGHGHGPVLTLRRNPPPPGPPTQVMYATRSDGSASNGVRQSLNEDALVEALRALLERRGQSEELIVLRKGQFGNLHGTMEYFAGNVRAIVGSHRPTGAR